MWFFDPIGLSSPGVDKDKHVNYPITSPVFFWTVPNKDFPDVQVRPLGDPFEISHDPKEDRGPEVLEQESWDTHFSVEAAVSSPWRRRDLAELQTTALLLLAGSILKTVSLLLSDELSCVPLTQRSDVYTQQGRTGIEHNRGRTGEDDTVQSAHDKAAAQWRKGFMSETEQQEKHATSRAPGTKSYKQHQHEWREIEDISISECSE